MDLPDTFPAGSQIFAASPADWLHIQYAKIFIDEFQLTSEDVRILRFDDTVVVETKREIKLLF